MKVLIVATHPDDEVLGCGGVICKHIEKGNSVEVIMVTEASDFLWDAEFRQMKYEEQKKVDRMLGISQRYQLSYRSLEIPLHPAKLSLNLSTYIRDLKPDTIYIPYNKDLHKDHTIVSECCLVATRSEITNAKIIMYEVPSEKIKPFKPNQYVDISNYINKKIEAFTIYESEIRASPHPRSKGGVKTLAKYRGNESNLQYAEAFKVIKEIC